ncbi:hypothetical protein [Flavobacterium orientale]|uniref:Lipoprotein n=1 Tax=Flavobacterium orientale TaxID=1756020 RepID=A0A916Y3E9_9FLAO|nr:hypothetical protein [Flavobacterium orientale]GGD29300.1 hypothetical protein GCM10011343_19310 [Flavobacterium orientale]
MKKFIPIFIGIVSLLVLTSCSHRLADTWRVTHYEIQNSNFQTARVTNIGTMSFDNNNRGNKNLEFNFFNTQIRDVSPFSWDDSKTFIVIKSDNSDLSRTWKKVKNKSNYQKWVNEDTSDEKRIIILRK